MPFVEFQGQPIYYAAYEKGKPEQLALVLVHGAGGTHLNWPPELRRLPETTVLALDLPGHGKSTGRGRRDVTEYADAVAAVLDDARIKRAVLCGHSMGSAIALTFALQRAERCAGLILIGPGARLKVAPAILDGILSDFTQTVRMLIEWQYGPDAPDQLKQLGGLRLGEVNPDVLYGDFLACDRFDVMDRLNEIESPALIICGAEDRMTPEKYARYLAEHLPRAELLLVPRAGHMVMLENSSAVGKVVAKFMSEVG